MSSIFIIPTSNGWNFVRSAAPVSLPDHKGSDKPGGGGEAPAAQTEHNGSWTVRKLQTLEEAVPLLSASDEFVLGLPISAVLAQRFRLPSVDPAEFPEMIRLQIEKLLPFPADEVTSDFEVIEQNETESVVSAIAIRNEQLAEMASPLLDRGYIPRQITVYAAQRASTHAPKGNALLIYPEGEMLVYAMTENGKLSLARSVERTDLSRGRDARLCHDRERQTQPCAVGRTQWRSASTRTAATAIERRAARHRRFLSKCFPG
jgi:hypothetical protein